MLIVLQLFPELHFFVITLANDSASSNAWFAPCPLNGLIGCAASPIRVTFVAFSKNIGVSSARSYTGYPETCASGVAFKI